MLVWIVPSHKEAATTSTLCYSTTQPLYEGTGKPEEQSQEESLAKWSTKSGLWSARSRVQAMKKALPLFRLYSTLKIDFSVMCLFLLVAITVRVKFVQNSHFRNTYRSRGNILKRCSARVPLVERTQIKKQSCGNDGYESLPG